MTNYEAMNYKDKPVVRLTMLQPLNIDLENGHTCCLIVPSMMPNLPREVATLVKRRPAKRYECKAQLSICDPLMFEFGRTAFRTN